MDLQCNGYVYVADHNIAALCFDHPGVRVALDHRRPPFIVVNSLIDQVVVARWPGRLWYVQVVEAVKAADEQAAKLMPLRPTIGYTSAISVDVLHEVPAWKLFGDHGEAICKLINRARTLELSHVETLGRLHSEKAANAYTRAWNNWFQQMKQTDCADNLAGTLGMLSGRSQSPINHGFSVLRQAVWDRASEISGESAFVHDADGETSLKPTWAAASNTLLHAAMALGAPSLSDDVDRQSMLHGWAHFIQSDVSRRDS